MGMIINSYSFSPYDPITAAWLAQLTTSFGSNPSLAFITALDTMIRGMRTDGDILLLDRFWIFAQEIQGYSRVSIVNPGSTQITEVNSPTWTANLGYAGNATTMYLNTNFTPSIHGVNYTLNAASYGIYSRTNLNVNQADIGTDSGTSRNYLQTRWSDGNSYFEINGNTGGSAISFTNSTGLISGVRPNSTSIKLFRNGIEIQNALDNSTGLSSQPFYVLAWNTGGAASFLSGRQLSMAYMGGNINQANFYSRFQTFAIAMGFNI